MASPPPCPHLRLHRNGSPAPFRSFHLCLRSKPPGGRAELRRDPGELRRCHACGLAAPRLLACLACAAISCRLHAPDHSSAHAPAHAIAVDVDRAELFCCACGDQVYDPDFDAAVVLAQTRSSPAAASAAGAAGAARKRRRVEYRPWSPTPREQQVIKWGSSPLWFSDAAASGPGVPWGLRGLNNLGSTCFMNSVLQAMLHAPPLRNYFLSDRHNPYLCRQLRGTRKAEEAGGNAHCRQLGSGSHRENSAASAVVVASSGKSSGSNADQAKVLCLVCDLDAIYSAVFSGSRTPYSPAKFLYSWWQHASNLASYEQQDAHEFFISMLDGIHEKLGRDQKKPHTQGSGDCCIAHRVFSGILRSDVTCTVCGFTSTTYDPCIDISLNLDSAHHSPRIPSSDDKDPGARSNGLCTLVGCLEHFTRPERLGSDQKLFCQQCQTRQESLKQMSIRKLPLVACFHIKRFEHSSSRKVSRKVDRYVQFPFSLDMGPYLSSSILRSRFGNRIFAFDATENGGLGTPASSEFELFAIVTHLGSLESGHYTTFLRLSGQWYKCDDAWITQVGETVVRAAQAYMLFYVQRVLYYRANDSV